MAATPRRQKSAVALAPFVDDYEEDRYEANRLHTAVDKLADATLNLSTALAKQSARIDNQDAISAQLKEEVRMDRQAREDNFLHLNGRIDDVRKELSEKLDNQTKAITDHFDNTAGEIKSTIKAVSERVTGLENYGWKIKGGFAVVGVMATALIGRIFYVLVGPDVIKDWFFRLF